MGIAILAYALLGNGRSAAQKVETAAKTDSPSPTTELAKLELFVGSWDFVETHFDEDGKVVATVKGKEETKWILDRRAVQRTYTSGTAPGLFRAIGTIAFDEPAKNFVGVWFDNASTTGPTQLTGTWDTASRSMVWTAESKTADGIAVRHRTVERFEDPATRTVTTYLLRGPQVVKTLEVRCTRSAPCPSDAVRLFDDR